jgi:hypothetical protein
LFLYTVTTNIREIITACDEFLYAFVIDLRRLSIQPLPEGILQFIPSILGTSENHVRPILDYMLDAPKISQSNS